VVDPMGDDAAARRALRGGSWLFGPRYARSAYRLDGHRDFRYDVVGLRLALRSASPAGGAGELADGVGPSGRRSRPAGRAQPA
jgi:hypothetical protein